MDGLMTLLEPQALIAFATLTALELVLGIDNIVFISILVDKLPPEKRERIRRLGLLFAMIMRIGLLLVISWIVGATTPLFSVFGEEFSTRDIILIAGGVFLSGRAPRRFTTGPSAKRPDRRRAPQRSRPRRSCCRS